MGGRRWEIEPKERGKQRSSCWSETTANEMVKKTWKNDMTWQPGNVGLLVVWCILLLPSMSSSSFSFTPLCYCLFHSPGHFLEKREQDKRHQRQPMTHIQRKICLCLASLDVLLCIPFHSWSHIQGLIALSFSRLCFIIIITWRREQERRIKKKSRIKGWKKLCPSGYIISPVIIKYM